MRSYDIWLERDKDTPAEKVTEQPIDADSFDEAVVLFISASKEPEGWWTQDMAMNWILWKRKAFPTEQQASIEQIPQPTD